MKEQLWILNSSLLFLLVFTISIGTYLQHIAPTFKPKKILAIERKPIKELAPEEIENIYKYDLFGTFVKQEFMPSLQQLAPPVPEMKPVSAARIEARPEPAFIEPLKISLKGIAYAADESKSISIIEDDTKKEQVYHTGDMIKDAQIIKIAQNRISLLRVNGQHETFFLRKDDNKQEEPKGWEHICKKIEDNTIELNLRTFPKEIPSVGSLAEKLSLLTVYEKGKPIGVKISKLEADSLGQAMGLAQNDIIKSINGINTADKKERVTIYDSLIQSKKGDTVKVLISRQGQDVELTYQLSFMEGPAKKTFTLKGEKDKEDKLFKLSRLQEREKKRREFAKKHKPKQTNIIDEIRKRLLENIQARVRNTRIR